MTIKTINPYTNEVVESFAELSAKEVNQKIEKAHHAYLEWRQTDMKTRSALLKKVASIMLKRKTELAKLITLEMGKLIGQSESEIEMCASVYQYYADNGEEFLKDKNVKVKDGKAFIRYTPIGPVLAVMPWNYPFNQVGRIAAPNIMAGKVFLVKKALKVTKNGQRIVNIF